ncbi:MAG: hypothetical protein ABID45_03700, partial [Patescibacteria group bacterium]
IKSRATLKVKAKKNRVKKNNKAKLTFTLKDKATKKKLKNKKVRILKKVKGNWRTWKRIKTNKKGKIVIRPTIKKKTRFKARWIPKKKSAEEYVSVTSKAKRIRLKK